MASGVREERGKLEFCPQAGEKGGCLRKDCLRLHLCPFFIKDKCTFGAKCRRSHNFSDKQTVRVLNHFRLGFLLNDRSNHSLTQVLSQAADESEIQLTAASRSVPDICKFYNKGVCKKGPNCPCLHVCEHFVDGDCKFGKNCKREHSLSDDHNKRVLQSYSIRDVQIVLQCLKGRERKRTVSEGSDVERPISAKPKSAMSDKFKPALSQGLSFDSKEKDCEICGFNLRGKCNYGDRCLNRHTELPYLWEFSVNDGDKWESFSSDLNTMLEEAYCDVDDGYKVRVGGYSCYVQFQDMTAVPVRGRVGGHKGFKVRRLSTVSSVVAPAGHIFSTRWNWYWQDENQKWQSYDSPVDGHAFNTTSSQCLEKEFVEGKESHPFSASHHQYTLYFKKMCQRNNVYKTERSVTRRPADLVTKENMKEIAQKRRAAVLGRQTVASAGSGSDGRPTHWTPMPDGIDYKRVPLPSISEGYKKAEKKFLETMEGHPNIVSIEQVQNTDLWTLYTQRKKHLTKRSGKEPEERQLFHGTNASTVEAISQQGFDWRMCGKHGTRYGKGTYFACRANYSHRYTQQGSGRRMMFLAKVLVGSFTNGDSEMIRPPAKDPLNPHVLYDSCCDNSSNPALFVIFENGQSYPEFLITYT
ncbi:PREDICTED: poly [ADP-ribose] polymerase 12-like [Acropora digitifera]|uniref:poly [ADP-ribose] polymerase 12-like n=1 Tax=Acropora digitifera TaxID=70779 RepID=UPI00077A9D82|nr:PREDICTED: poly [ADP-ribose] polymerase 12-like [Acropora digitifera]